MLLHDLMKSLSDQSWNRSIPDIHAQRFVVPRSIVESIRRLDGSLFHESRLGSDPDPDERLSREIKEWSSGHLDRIDFNDKWEELHRESMLWELRQRVRDVRQGPDGLLYLLTAENDGALIRIEPGTSPVAQK